MAGVDEFARAFVEAFNAHDEGRMKEVTGEGNHLVAPGDVDTTGRDASVAYAMAWLDAFPDATMTVTNQVLADPWVVQEFVFEGTHTATLAGPSGEIPATGKRLRGRAVQLMKVDDGATVEDHLYFDQVQVLTQLGLMPEPATA